MGNAARGGAPITGPSAHIDNRGASARIHKSADILLRETEQKRIRNAEKYM
jgi:hypothetical protein